MVFELIEILEKTEFMKFDEVKQALTTIESLLEEEKSIKEELGTINEQYKLKTRKILKIYHLLFNETFSDEEGYKLGIYQKQGYVGKVQYDGKFISLSTVATTPNGGGSIIYFTLTEDSKDEDIFITPLVEQICLNTSLHKLVKELGSIYTTGINKRKEKIKQDVEKLKNELNEKKEALKKIASALTTDD